jgi:thiol-disulfide isomerase/thioredoxin
MQSGPWSPVENRRLRAGVFLVVAALAGLTGFYFSRASLITPAADGAAQRLMLAPLADLSGRPQTLSQWRGKVLVVNFWATWCSPCRVEIPGFIELHRELADQGVQFVGIAIDQSAKVNDFARELGVNYPLLIGEDSALELQRQLGDQAGVLPFTVVLDSSGRLVTRHQGGMSAKQLRSILLPLTRRI